MKVPSPLHDLNQSMKLVLEVGRIKPEIVTQSSRKSSAIPDGEYI